MIGGHPLDGVGDDFPGPPVSLRLRLFLDLPNHPQHVGPGVALDLGQELRLGLLATHTRDALQFLDRLPVQSFQLVVLSIEGALALAEHLVAFFQLVHPLVELAASPLQPFFFLGQIGSPAGGAGLGLVLDPQRLIPRLKLDLAAPGPRRLHHRIGFGLPGLVATSQLSLLVQDPQAEADGQGHQRHHNCDPHETVHRSLLACIGVRRPSSNNRPDRILGKTPTHQIGVDPPPPRLRFQTCPAAGGALGRQSRGRLLVQIGDGGAGLLCAHSARRAVPPSASPGRVVETPSGFRPTPGRRRHRRYRRFAAGAPRSGRPPAPRSPCARACVGPLAPRADDGRADDRRFPALRPRPTRSSISASTPASTVIPIPRPSAAAGGTVRHGRPSISISTRPEPRPRRRSPVISLMTGFPTAPPAMQKAATRWCRPRPDPICALATARTPTTPPAVPTSLVGTG